jgi:uncharacterized membrane protein YqhA
MNVDLSHGDPNSSDPDDDPRHHRAVLGLIVGSSRFGVLFAIFGLGLASTLLLIYATLVVLKTIWDTVTSSTLDVDYAKHIAVVFIELTDAFLLGTVLYIIGLGLYQLFIDATLPLPGWLKINTIDQLKSKLVGVIVVLLGVSFLAAVVEGSAGRGLLDLGIATSVVILALGVHGYLSGRSNHRE